MEGSNRTCRETSVAFKLCESHALPPHWPSFSAASPPLPPTHACPLSAHQTCSTPLCLRALAPTVLRLSLLLPTPLHLILSLSSNPFPFFPPKIIVSLEAQFAQFEHVLQILVMDLCGLYVPISVFPAVSSTQE